MSETLQITLPDGSSKQVPAGTTVADFVKTQIGAGLARAALYARLDDEDLDLSRPLSRGGKLTVVTNKQREGLDLIRHDAAHVVASVVQRLFPGTQVTIGPHTEEGFYYDFFRKEPFTPEDLEKIEKAANEEIRKDLPFVRNEVSREEALQLFDKLGETFKKEIVEDIFNKGAKTLTLYSHGDWVDFCLGPHAPSTGKIGVIKLLNVAAPTGAATIAIRSSSASTGRPSSTRRTSMPGSSSRRKRASGTTASWGASWTCSPSTPRRPARCSGRTGGRPCSRP